MRQELERRDGLRGTFRGTFVRLGGRRGWKGANVTTVLLYDVTDKHGKVVCDHLWFDLVKVFEALDMQPGDVIEFDARITSYWKGYRGWRWEDYDAGELDYRLSHPTKARKVTKEDVSTLPLFKEQSE